jgi:hypothetical protein
MSIRHYRPTSRRAAGLGRGNKIALITSCALSLLLMQQSYAAPIHRQAGFLVFAGFCASWLVFLFTQITLGPTRAWLTLLAVTLPSYLILLLEFQSGWPFGLATVHHYFGNLGQLVFGVPIVLCCYWYAWTVTVLQLARRISNFYAFLISAVVIDICSIFLNLELINHRLISWRLGKSLAPKISHLPLSYLVGGALFAITLTLIASVVIPNLKSSSTANLRIGWLETISLVLIAPLIFITARTSLAIAIFYGLPVLLFFIFYYLSVHFLTPEF